MALPNQTSAGFPRGLLLLPLTLDKRLADDNYRGFNKNGDMCLCGRLFFGHLHNGNGRVETVRAGEAAYAHIDAEARKARAEDLKVRKA